MELISFVILHYGSIQITDECIESIQKLDEYQRVRIIIVDNEVNKSSLERDRTEKHYKKIENVTVLRAKGAGGFSEANNIGYKYAREKQKARFIILMNNDIVVLQKDFIDRLETSFIKYQSYILGPDIIKCDTGEHQNPLATRLRTEKEAVYTMYMNRLALKFFLLLFPAVRFYLKVAEKKAQEQKKKEPGLFENVQKQVVLFGAFLIFTPFYIEEEAKALYPETEFYYEEFILAARCKEKGWSMVYDPSLRILHKSGSATEITYRGQKEKVRFMLKKTADSCEIYLNYLRKGIITAP